ncbi:MAG: precorrin-8X methylmutase [Spirochaetota bacterium]|nr:precorrin-8X methylmutase [Spirochaetota bacterium]
MIYMRPEEIEGKSMRIIENELGDFLSERKEREIIKRVAHATADTEFAKSIIFHPDAVDMGLRAIISGCNIIADVEMVRVGIRKKEIEEFGNELLCFINNDKAVQMAEIDKIPKAVSAMRMAKSYINGSIVVIGNAPTALFELINIIERYMTLPALVIGVPIGFVGAAESKEALQSLSVPYITNEGRRGGSAVAVSIINALIKLTAD